MAIHTMSNKHPFIMRDYGLGVMEVICIDFKIGAAHKVVDALFTISKKYKNIVFTLPPQAELAQNMQSKLEELSKLVDLKLVRLEAEQIPFKVDFIECFTSSDDAVMRLKGKLVTEKVMKDFNEITPFKSSALQIIGLLDEPEISFERIEKCVITEPLLVARVLQAANSAYYMRRNKIENLIQALAYLGVEGIKQVLVQMIFQNFATKYFAQQQAKLVHSDCTSFLAVKLAEKRFNDPKLASKVKIAALLHDIGSLALHYCFPKDYAKVAMLSRKHNIQIPQAEYMVFGTNHCEVGKKLCKEWRIPDYVVLAIEKHHNFPSGGEESLILEPIICANGFLNLDMESQPYLDYTQLLPHFSNISEHSRNDAIMEVKNYLQQLVTNYQAQIKSSD